MKYRTKQVEVEAAPFADPEAATALAETGAFRFPSGTSLVSYENWRLDGFAGCVFDYLHETWVPFHSTDMLIKGTKGELYPCEPGVFETKYEVIR